MNEKIKNDPGFPKMKSGYTVPEGYFESFGDRLKLKMEVTPAVSSTRRAIVYLRPALGFAAGLAILLSVYLHIPNKAGDVALANVQSEVIQSADDQTDQLPNTYASLVTEGQFLSALTEMDEYDASQIPTDGLADYLASNCSEMEILNSNK